MPTELAVVIGRPARNVSKVDALSYVAGYTVANDVSGRHWQRKGRGEDQELQEHPQIILKLLHS